MGKVKEALQRFRRRVERLSPSEWCERYIALPPGKNEAKPGRLRWSYAPYIKEWIDCLDVPGVRDIAVVAPTRFGKTLLLRMVFACCVGRDPKPFILFDSTIDKGRNLVRKEIKPLVEYNAALRDLKPADRHHYTDGKMLFPGAAFDVFGANSPAGAAGDTAKVILGNEVDKWRGESTKEASMMELAKHRTESAEGERKHFFSSTPTTEQGDIWKEFLNGDQRRFYVPCPHCGEMQTLTWDRVKWEEDAQDETGEWDMDTVKRTARYVCPHCQGKWDDKMRLQAVRDKRSEWRPTTKPKVPGTRSYQINGLYGPLQAHRLGELAVDFLASRRTGFYTSRRDFWNSRMGEPWRDEVSDLTAERFKLLEVDYQRGDLPEGWVADLLVYGVDVQSYGFPWVCLAFQWSGECRTVDHGLAAEWKDIDGVQFSYRHLAPESYVIVDVGYEQRTPEVLENIHARQHRGWLGASGWDQTTELTKVSQRDPFLGTKRQNIAAVAVLNISTYEFKREWEERITKKIDTWRTYKLPARASTSEKREQAEYYSQLLDEKRVIRKKPRPGKPPYEWVCRTGNNHFWDCHVYALALFYHLARSKAFKSRARAGKKRRGPLKVK